MKKSSIALLLLVTACSKEKAQPSSEASSASAAATVPTAAASSTTASKGAASPSGRWYVGDWKGSFTATKRASTTKTKEGGPAAWEKDEGQKLAGPGAIDLSIDDQGGVTGTLKGALGDLALSGSIDGEGVRAKILSKNDDPTAIQNGYLVLAHEADKLSGRLLVGSGDALTLRQAEVSLTKAARQ